MVTSNQTQLQPDDFAIIEGLAKEISWPVKEVENLYAEIFGRLSSSARVRDFLIVLTCKNVRNVLRHAKKSAMSRDSAVNRKPTPDTKFISKGDPSR